jgi:predicted Zn-dependent protease
MLNPAETPLQLVRTQTSISWSTLKGIQEGIEGSLGHIVKDYNIITHDLPTINSIKAKVLLNSLLESYGHHTLCIIDAFLENDDSDYFYKHLYGGKLQDHPVAAVSTRWIDPGNLSDKSNYELYMDRLVKLCLHEEGHNLGLTDHASFQTTKDGTLCPMSRGEFNKFGMDAYATAVVDGRGLRYCRECTDFLDYHYGKQSSF